MNEKLGLRIQNQFEEISNVFAQFQQHSGLVCRQGCGQCCFKKHVYCTPIELLPLGLKLLQEKKAEEFLERALANLDNHCILLDVHNEELGAARCSQYEHRPFLCRSFAISARKNKHEQPEFSVCKIIKQDFPDKVAELEKSKFSSEGPPYMEIWRKKLVCIDPQFLEQEHPINKSLSIILEKLLLIDSLK